MVPDIATGFDASAIIGVAIEKILFPIALLAFKAIGSVLLVILIFALYVIIRLRMNPFTKGYRKVIKLKRMDINFKFLDFVRWVYVDVITSKVRHHHFKPYGFTIFLWVSRCGQINGYG